MRIAAVAHSVPTRRVDNEELIGLVLRRNADRYDAAGRAQLETRLRDHFDQTGIRSRYWRADQEKASTLALAAGARALEEADVEPGEVDLLLYVGVGRGWVEPAMANYYLAGLGLINATGFDILDACASWLRALDLAASLVRLGRHRNILILNSECNVREYCGLDVPSLESLEHLMPRFTIGEAATATVVRSEGPDDEFHSLFRTWGADHDLCRIPLPNQADYPSHGDAAGHEPLQFYAYGTPLARKAVRRIIMTYRADPHFRSLRPDICFGHSVSEVVTSQVEQLVRMPRGMVYRTVAQYGNTVSASLPLGMSLASRDGTLCRGQTVLFIMGSAGISVGLASLKF
jgi:3-oxoacyl-[acyl-carrier-protein] synthase III